MWSLWNEPNFGEDLGPQAINDSTILTAPMAYRGLANQGYNALKADRPQRMTRSSSVSSPLEGSEPGRNPRSTGACPETPGRRVPQLFLRQLYCVGNNFKPLTGSAAKAVGCPTNAAASRKFRSQNPGLFNVSGLSDPPLCPEPVAR